MSYTVIRTIHCDRCSTWTEHPDDPLATATQIRQAVRRQGWKVGLPGGEDICPECPEDEVGRG